jgi:DNA-binding transcriptional ArsR family regulator
MNSMSHLDAAFAALADPTRRAILARLAAGDASVTELAKPFAMSQPAISKHIKVLERAGGRAGSPSSRSPRSVRGSKATASSGNRVSNASMLCSKR